MLPKQVLQHSINFIACTDIITLLPKTSAEKLCYTGNILASFSSRNCNEYSALMNINTEQNCKHERFYTSHDLLQS